MNGPPQGFNLVQLSKGFQVSDGGPLYKNFRLSTVWYKFVKAKRETIFVPEETFRAKSASVNNSFWFFKNWFPGYHSIACWISG